MDNSSKNKRDRLIYVLEDKDLKFITIYYILFLLVGMAIIIYIMIHLNNLTDDNLMLFTITASLSVCSMLCSIQYLKRIYKACLDGRVISSSNEKPTAKFGNVVYFILRPIYAFAFVIIAIFAMLSGFVILTSSLDYILNDRFLYLCIIISSFIGFSIGRVLDGFESLSITRVNEIFKYSETEHKHGE